MTRTTGIPAWFAGRIITMDTRIAFFYFCIVYDTHTSASPSSQLAPPSSRSLLRHLVQTYRPCHSLLVLRIPSMVDLWLAVGWMKPMSLGDFDEDWTSRSRLMEDMTRRRRKTAALCVTPGHVAHTMLARPSCFPLSSVPSCPGPDPSIRACRRTTP